MASSLIILMPNGRRQTVKVTPNTTILQVLEEACNKHGFKPDEYDIKHHRKILDTTTTIRFSGLPNKAQLELIKTTRTRIESEVMLMIQCEDGKRLMGNFAPGISLWDVLCKLCPLELNNPESIVLIYTRNEIIGEENLKKNNLKSIGLVGGRAMMRLIHRLPQELPIAEPEFTPLHTVEDVKNENVQSETSTTAQIPLETSNLEKSQKYKEPFNPLKAIKQKKQKQTDGLKTKNAVVNVRKESDNCEAASAAEAAAAAVRIGEREAAAAEKRRRRNLGNRRRRAAKRSRQEMVLPPPPEENRGGYRGN